MAFLSSAFARRTLLYIVGGVLALLGIVVVTVFLAARTGDHAEEVLRASTIRTLSSNVLTALLEAETGQRGFLLTGERTYLEPYDAARAALEPDLQGLRALGQNDPYGARAAARITELAAARLTGLGQAIDLASAGRQAEALALVRTNVGNQIMAETRAVLTRWAPMPMCACWAAWAG